MSQYETTTGVAWAIHADEVTRAMTWDLKSYGFQPASIDTDWLWIRPASASSFLRDAQRDLVERHGVTLIRMEG